VAKNHYFLAVAVVAILLIPSTFRAEGIDFPVKSTELEITNSDGIVLNIIGKNNEVHLTSTITTTTQTEFVAVMDLRNENGITELLKWQKGMLDDKESTDVSFSWKPNETGDYEAKLFVLSSFDGPKVLSNPTNAKIIVAENSVAYEITAPAITNSPKLADYTVMVYMVASDLESEGYFATADIEEMMAVGSTPEVNVVVETGGAANAKIDDKRFIDFTKVQRHKIEQGKVTTIENLGEQNMGDPRTLSSFISWAAEEFPANKYVIILWDHGNGLHGFGKDDIFNDNLTLNEINEAFGNNVTVYEKFEIIGFDACLMASVEVANRVAPFGNYFVASEELEPAWGWDYSAILASMTKTPTQDGLSLGKVIVDSYVEHSKFNSGLHENYDADKTITLSVIDLAKVPDVVKATSKLSDWFDLHMDREHTYSLAKTIRGTERYGESGQDSSGHLDLYSLTDNIGKQFPDMEVFVSPVKKSIADAVVYTANGQAKPDAHGISMYMQIEEYEGNAPYLQYITGNWISTLEKSRKHLENDITPPRVVLQMNDEIIQGSISTEDLADISLMVLHDSEETRVELVSFQQQDPSSIMDSDGEVDFTWNKEVMSLCSGPDCEPTLAFIEKNGSIQYAYYPVTVETENFTGSTILIYTINANGEFDFLGAWPGIDEQGNAARQLLALVPGDRVYSYTYEFDWADSSYFQVVEHGPLTVQDNFGPDYRSFTGQYTMIIQACDFSNNCSYSEAFAFQVE